MIPTFVKQRETRDEETAKGPYARESSLFRKILSVCFARELVFSRRGSILHARRTKLNVQHSVGGQQRASFSRS